MRYGVLFLLLIGFGSCNTMRVIPVHSDTKLNKEGVFYYLPKTTISVDVTVKETRYFKGPFAQYSAKFTGISNVIQENKTVSEVSGIKVETMSEPDTSKLFYIYTRGIKKNEPFSLLLNEAGCIVGLNAANDNQHAEVVSDNNLQGTANNGRVSSAGFELPATSNTRIKTDTIIEKIILDTVTIEKQILEHSIIEKSAEDKAKDAADYISLISENKMNLLAGLQEVDYNQATFISMLNELDAMLADYLNLFTGKSVESTRQFQFQIEPGVKASSEPQFLFSFNDQLGSADAFQDSVSAVNYYYMLVPVNRTEPIVQMNSNVKHSKNKGLAYNIPEECTLMILNDENEIVFSEKIKVSQLGTTNYLPADMRQIRFNAADGSVNTIIK